MFQVLCLRRQRCQIKEDKTVAKKILGLFHYFILIRIQGLERRAGRGGGRETKRERYRDRQIDRADNKNPGQCWVAQLVKLYA
jgi:hypothetical protein